ncbi:MAG: molybdopterin molybdenumtransferase MoeA, partial [Gemmatimonadota bacterium]|nr:molybdopterin molybdenumtransferase MoeA [Gemmatimonadota bacterium]
MRTVADAAAEILAAIRVLESEAVPLRDALGRVLAADVASPVDLPPWDNSSMDGYAVRAADVAGATRGRPAALAVIGTIAAGARGERPVGPGQAYRIM